MQFIKSNYIYVLWFIFYFTIVWILLGANAQAFGITFLIYAVSITIALSPLGECLLRIMEGARALQTKEEIEYLQPLFDEVYENAKQENPKLSDGIKLYIMDAMFVNAFAMGRKTITVTKGAVETFTPEELKGVIAHEFGHISYGHTKALLLSVIGNLILSVFVFIIRLGIIICDFLCNVFSRTSIVVVVISIINLLFKIMFEVSLIGFMYIGQVILSLNSRSNEFQADSFACKISYGEQLISALYLLQKISISQKMSFKEKMISSHPHISKRIARLENMNEDLEFAI